MKKTLRVNISGTIFNIDEDAYHKLKKYLDVIEGRYNGNEEQVEIFSDIESRVAELLSDKITSHKTVINQIDIDEVINTMGTPDDFDDTDNDTNNEETENTQTFENKNKRRMYRDSEAKYIAGVASGVSHYFGIDPLIIRALFIVSLFFAGTGFFIYLILWIALPEALTSSQKLEMTGKAVTISNIENSLNEEFKNVKENFDKFKESGKFDDLKNGTNRVVKGIGSFILTILKIILILFGVFLVISAVSAIFGLTGGLFFADTIVSLSSEGIYTLDHWALIDLVDDSNSKYLAYIGLILTAILPLIIMLFFGLKLIFKFRSNNKIILLSSLGLWLMGLVLLASSAFSISSNFKQKGEFKERYELDFPKGKTLVLDIKAFEQTENEEMLVIFHDFGIMENDSTKLRTVLLLPRVEILPSMGDKIIIQIRKEARGQTNKEAHKNAKEITLNWTQTDSIIEIDQFFKFLAENKFRNQEVWIEIKIPTGEKMFISKSFNQMDLFVKNTEYFWDYEVTDRELIMAEEGVSIPPCLKKNKHSKDASSFEEEEITDDVLEDLQEELN